MFMLINHTKIILRYSCFCGLSLQRTRLCETTRLTEKYPMLLWLRLIYFHLIWISKSFKWKAPPLALVISHSLTSSFFGSFSAHDIWKRVVFFLPQTRQTQNPHEEAHRWASLHLPALQLKVCPQLWSEEPSAYPHGRPSIPVWALLQKFHTVWPPTSTHQEAELPNLPSSPGSKASCLAIHTHQQLPVPPTCCHQPLWWEWVKLCIPGSQESWTWRDAQPWQQRCGIKECGRCRQGVPGGTASRGETHRRGGEDRNREAEGSVCLCPGWRRST